MGYAHQHQEQKRASDFGRTRAFARIEGAAQEIASSLYVRSARPGDQLDEMTLAIMQAHDLDDELLAVVLARTMGILEEKLFAIYEGAGRPARSGEAA